MSLQTARKTLSGWGRYKPAPCEVARPESQIGLRDELAEGLGQPVIARGLGRSYGDAAVNEEGLVLDLSRLNRFIGFDEAEGVLECEGGVSLAKILAFSVPRGFFLPVTPGTKFVTVAGALAHDVHGKNHHRDGSFSRFVESFRLWTPARGILACSRRENTDVFQATAGGAGLTGIILTLRLRLRAIPSAYVRVDYRRCDTLDKALEAMEETDRDYLYSVAWLDCFAPKTSLGRSVLMCGNPAQPEDLPEPLRNTPYRLSTRPSLSVPFDLPSFFLNHANIKAFNTVFYAVHRTASRRLVDYEKYFYPLDGIRQWNRLYGKRGFVQYQATFPFDQRAGLVRLLERLQQTGNASFLAVLKCFGEAGPGLLSYPLPGYTLALDIPYRPGLETFTRALDRILLDHGGRLYLAKDALALPETISAMYPRLDEFRRLRRTLDPARILRSNLSRRLCLDGKYTQTEPAVSAQKK